MMDGASVCGKDPNGDPLYAAIALVIGAMGVIAYQRARKKSAG